MSQNKSIFSIRDAIIRVSAPVLALLLFGSSNPDPYPKDYFRSPLGIPLVLAGSFAEMRSNHFHSGLDIKTNGRSGYRVYAAADGWIARISVAAGGFGNALYVEHPNGYMTVYAHLDKFSPELSEYIQNLQYARKQFAVNAFPTKGRLPVAKGDVIAFSGNSGSSSGPHLHFEIRNLENGWPENPLLFGFDIPDTQPPRIRGVKLYTIDENSQLRIRDRRTGGWNVIGGNNGIILDVTSENGTYGFSRADRIEAKGRIGFGVQTYDAHDGSNNRLGAYRINLSVDGNSIYASRMESFSFSQTRIINAHVDYGERIRNRRWIQRSHLLPGNILPFYDAVDSGILTVDEDRLYRAEYRISDEYGNETTLPIELNGTRMSDEESIDTVKTKPDKLFASFDEPFVLDRPGFSVRIPAGALYEDTELTYAVDTGKESNTYGPVHRFHRNDTPVQVSYSISLDASEVPERLRSKATLAMVRDNGQLAYAGGSYSDGKIVGSSRSFGRFTISADTTAPSIQSINLSNGKNMRKAGNIRFRIRDNFSGIKQFKGLVDGKWVLFAFDAKSGMLRHTFDGRIGPGTHELNLEVVDQVGNQQTYKASFVL